MTIDDRSFVMQAVMTLDVPSSVVYFYPRLMPLIAVSPESTEIPFPIRCSIENMEDTGIYLLGNFLAPEVLLLCSELDYLLTLFHLLF